MRRALLVEDEALGGFLIRDMLEGLGWAVDGPHVRVEDAIEALGRGGFAVALLDVNLGGERSWPVADAAARAGVPVVFATGYDPRTPELTARGAPILTKPFTEAALRAALDRLGLSTDA